MNVSNVFMKKKNPLDFIFVSAKQNENFSPPTSTGIPVAIRIFNAYLLSHYLLIFLLSLTNQKQIQRKI